MPNLAKNPSTKKLGINYYIRQDKNLFRLIIMLIFVFLLMSVLKPDLFLRGDNFISMAKQFPEYGLLAIAIGVTMITGGIDLSVVAIANLSAIFAAKFLLAAIPDGASTMHSVGMILVAIIIALVIGALAGFVNGLLISKANIPAILATLGTYQLFSGLAIVITEGRSISGLPILFSEIGNATIFGVVPVLLIVFTILAVATGYFLSKTKYGKELYLLGTNEKASHYSGLRNDRILYRTYMISGVLAAFAGLIMMARSNSVNADYGAEYTLQCVLIAVLGGINPKGGFGNVQGIVVAIFILQILSTGLNMFSGISNFYRDIIWGGVLVLVLIFNYYVNKREQQKLLRQT